MRPSQLDDNLSRNDEAAHSSYRRFPPPWSVEEMNACFIARDRNYQTLTCVYFEDEPGRRSAASLLTKGEARLLD
jgi:hypothetical protein